MPAGKISYKLAVGQPGFEVATPYGPPQVKTPFGAAEPNHRIYTQRYWQLAKAYMPASQNELCPPSVCGSDVAYFCEDTERTPVGVADVVSFDRTWATLPASVEEPSSVNVVFPTLLKTYSWTSAGITYHSAYVVSKSFSLNCFAKSFLDYFLVGKGGVYKNYINIPQLGETIYTGPDFSTAIGTVWTDAQWAGLIGTSQRVGILSGAVLTDVGWTAGYYYVGSSTIRRYQGNIWERRSVSAFVA